MWFHAKNIIFIFNQLPHIFNICGRASLPETYTWFVISQNLSWETYHRVSFTLLPYFSMYALTIWGRVTHICVSKQTIIGSDNGLSSGRRQAIIWTNVAILLIRTLGTNFSEILRIELTYQLLNFHFREILMFYCPGSLFYTFSFKKMHLKMSSAK